MAITAAQLEVHVGADTRDADRGLDRMDSRVRRAGQSVTSFGQGMASAGRTATRRLTVPIVAAGAAIAQTGANFDAEMSKIVGLVGVAQDEVDGMREGVLELAGETARAPQELAEAMFFVTSAGFRGSQAMDVLEVSAKAAAAGLGETAVIADAVTSAINAFGEENVNATQATDILTAAVREGKLEAETLAPVLGRLMPIAAEMGITFDETAGFLAAMSRTGLDAAEASTALRSMMAQLLNPSQQARDTLEEFGLSASGLRQSIREDGLLSTLHTLRDTFGDNEEALNQVFPNVRALSGVLNVLGQDGETVEAVMAGVADSAGSVDDAFQTASETARFQIDKALNDLKVLLVDLSADVLPHVVFVMERVSEGVRGLTRWWGQLDDSTRSFIVRAAGVAAAVGPVLFVVGKLVAVVGALISPVGAVVAGLGLLALGLRRVWRNSETFRTVVGGALEAVGSVVGPVVERLTGGFGSAEDAMGDFDRAAHDAAVEAGRVSDAWARDLVPAVEEGTRTFEDAVDDTIETAARLGVEIPETLGSVNSAYGEMAGTHEEQMSRIQEREHEALNAMRDGWTQHVEETPSVWEEMWRAIGDLTGSFGTAVVDLVDTVVLTPAETFWAEHGESITSIASDTWGVLGRMAEEGGRVLVGSMDTLTALLEGDWSEAWEEMKTTSRSFNDFIKEFTDPLVRDVKSMVSSAGTAIRAEWDEQWEQWKSDLEDIVDWFADLPGRIREQINKIPGAVSSAIDTATATLRRLSPFHKESPSLVDLVRMGTDEIARQYAALSGLRIDAPRLGGLQAGGVAVTPRPAVAAAPSGGGRPLRVQVMLDSRVVADRLVDPMDHARSRRGRRGQ